MINKHDDLVIRLKEWIDREYSGGRVTTLSTQELESKILELSNGKYKPV